MAYRVSGQGKPLILLHGWGSSSQVMAPVSSSLSHIRTCYLIDLPGFGQTPEPGEAWNIDDYANLIASFIESLDGQHVDLLAHSFGGRIALKLLSRSGISSKIDKVLITGGAGMKPHRTPSYYLKKYVAKIVKAPFFLLPSVPRERGLRWLRTTALWKSMGSADYRVLTGVMRETFVKTVTDYLEPILIDIHQDVLLLWGKEDDATPLYQAERMEQGLKNGVLVVIEEAGHYAFLDKPRKFSAIAEAYFKG